MKIGAGVYSLFAVASAVGLSCGDDSSCPESQCHVVGTTVVKWTFNHYPDLKFTDDSCNEIGSTNVSVTLTKVDDPAVTVEMTKGCNDKQVSFLDLEPGSYNVAVTPLDINDNSLVKEAATGVVMSGAVGANTEVEINVPYTAWVTPYTGTFLFQLRWGTMGCATATPPIVTQLLTMTLDGNPVTTPTHTGMQMMNGIDAKPCMTMFDYIELLPFGPASIAIIGKDAGGVVRFQQQYDTFVGVGTFNPTITYDLPLPDAAVDAPPDAPPDAAPDAPPDTM